MSVRPGRAVSHDHATRVVTANARLPMSRPRPRVIIIKSANDAMTPNTSGQDSLEAGPATAPAPRMRPLKSSARASGTGANQAPSGGHRVATRVQTTPTGNTARVISGIAKRFTHSPCTESCPNQARVSGAVANAVARSVMTRAPSATSVTRAQRRRRRSAGSLGSHASTR